MLASAFLFTLLSGQATFGQTFPLDQDQREKVYIHCVFRFTQSLTCNDFKDAFFSDFKSFVSRSEAAVDSDLELNLVDEPLSPTSIGYQFTWTSHLETLKDSNFSYPLILKTTLDRLAQLNQLTLNASKGFSIFLKIQSGEIKKDSMILTYSAPETPTESEHESWLSRFEKSPWFINFKGVGNYSENGNSLVYTRNTNASSNLEVAYIKTRFKTNLNGGFAYSEQSLKTLSSGTFTAESIKTSLSGIVIYTLTPPKGSSDPDSKKGSWSVAVFQSESSDSGANIQNLSTTMTGVEWTLVPFRTTQNNELAFRFGPEYNSLKLKVPNDLNHLEEKYWRALARIYFYWVTLDNKMTLTLGATGEANLTYKDRSSWSLNGQVNYQVSRSISVNAGVRRVFAPKPMLWYPAPDAMINNGNPLQGAFQTGQPGGQLMINIGFAVSLGNSIRKQRDRRWAN